MKLLKLLSCCIRAQSEETEREMQRSEVEVREPGLMADESVHLDLSCNYPDDLAASLIALFSKEDNNKKQSTPQLSKEDGAGDRALTVARSKLDPERFLPRVAHERRAPPPGAFRTAPTPEQRDVEEEMRRENRLHFFARRGIPNEGAAKLIAHKH